MSSFRAFLLALAALALSASACGRDPLAPEREALRGDWEWVRACCDIAGVAKTPASEGVRYVFRFRASGSALVLRNDSLLVRTTYAVRPHPDGIPVVRFRDDVPGGRERLLIEVNDTLLVLGNWTRDNYPRWYFARRP